MEKDTRMQSSEEIGANEKKIMDRRVFLISLKKWSKIVIGGVLLGNAVLSPGAEKEAEAAAWANKAGPGGAWANRGAAWVNGGGAWANKAGPGGAWANRGAAWVNGGGTWVNRF